MIKKILSDKNDKGNERQNYPNSHQNNNSNRRYANRTVEDTGSIITDYTEDDRSMDIDLPLEKNNSDARNNNNNVIYYQDSPVQTNNINSTGSKLNNGPSASSWQNCGIRSSSNGGGRRRNQRRSAPLTRNEENRAKKRSHTCSTEVFMINLLLFAC